jgi:hypothetical protein
MSFAEPCTVTDPLSVLDTPSARSVVGASAPAVTVAGRRLQATVVFDTYWRFAAARQALYEARLAGAPNPWTADPILRGHRFTNCFRAADRVSQFAISEVAYGGAPDPKDVVFRVLLFKLFNKVSTWQLLERELGELTWSQFDVDTYDRVLTPAFAGGQRLYSAAYLMPPPALGGHRKHTNHLRLLDFMMHSQVVESLLEARSMRAAFEVLRVFPAIGDFLAFQFLIDLNYSEVLNFDEMEFVVAGPGARDGLRKVFGPAAKGIEADVIRYMADTQEEHFERLGLRFGGLRGRRLQLIDCQNLFCEVDKYSRVAHPDVSGISGRTRIKQKFAPEAAPLSAWFPPKWGLNDLESRPVTPRVPAMQVPTLL